MSMKFVVENKDETKPLSVKLQMDGTDVDIVVTDKNGEEHTIAYLSEDGLTICSTDCEEIERDSEDRIEYVLD